MNSMIDPFRAWLKRIRVDNRSTNLLIFDQRFCDHSGRIRQLPIVSGVRPTLDMPVVILKGPSEYTPLIPSQSRRITYQEECKDLTPDLQVSTTHPKKIDLKRVENTRISATAIASFRSLALNPKTTPHSPQLAGEFFNRTVQRPPHS
jgi:hypothetical protein